MKGPRRVLQIIVGYASRWQFVLSAARAVVAQLLFTVSLMVGVLRQIGVRKTAFSEDRGGDPRSSKLANPISAPMGLTCCTNLKLLARTGLPTRPFAR